MKKHTLRLTDDEAAKAGDELARDFGLKRADDHPDRWQTENGSFRNQGISRRAIRIIQDAMDEPPGADLSPLEAALAAM